MPLENEDKLPYGFLNPVDTTYGPGKGVFKVDNQPFTKTLKEIARDRFSRDVLAGVPEYVAICLAKADPLIPEDSQTMALNAFGVPVQAGSQQRFYARIPEIHTHLPLPKDNKDWDVIRMYPMFIGASELEAAESGQLIRVTFKNVYNQQGPMYLGPVYGGNKTSTQVSNDEKNQLSGEQNSGANTTNMPEQKTTNYVSEPLTPSDPNYKEKLSEAMKNVWRPQGFEAKNGQKFSLMITPRPVKFTEYKRPNNILDSIIIHESVDDSLQGTERALLKQDYGVHFTIDKEGNVYSYNDPKMQVIHENITNPRSIGVEIINCYHAYRRSPNDKRDIIIGEWVFKSKNEPNPGSYVVPSRKQLESAFKLIKNLCLSYNIPIAFPAMLGSMFKWGLSPGLKAAAGISSHQHIHAHSDGTFIEYYVICRFSNMNAETAYNATKNAAQTTTRGQLTPISSNLTISNVGSSKAGFGK